MPLDIRTILDLDRYPLDQPDSSRYRSVVNDARSALSADGCVVLEELVRPAARATMQAEVATIKSATHYSETAINAYFETEPDPTLPARHPRNIFLERSSGFTPGDAFPDDSPIEAVYRWPALLAFLADCLQIPEIHCYSDPLACLTVNVLNPGQEFSWHYDNNDFAVTMLLDEADEGGQFRYAPNIRSRDDENADAAAAVMLGDDSAVTSLDLRPGDLQIFQGRYSLHQVTRVSFTSRPRHAAVFAYTIEAGLIGGIVRTRQLFGRHLPVHERYARGEAVRHDALID